MYTSKLNSEWLVFYLELFYSHVSVSPFSHAQVQFLSDTTVITGLLHLTIHA